MSVNFDESQHTAEWYRSRLGRITGSKVGVLMKKGRSNDDPFSATARTYMRQVAGERALNPAVTGEDEMLMFFVEQSNTSSKAMRFGAEQEPTAREQYCDITHHTVQEVGLCPHDTVPMLASSPDGLVLDGNGTLGTLEIKCPGLGTFTQYCAEVECAADLLRVNPDYYWQCMCHMACTNAQWCDFFVFCPFAVKPWHMVRIMRDDKAIAEMERRVLEANECIRFYTEKLLTDGTTARSA